MQYARVLAGGPYHPLLLLFLSGWSCISLMINILYSSTDDAVEGPVGLIIAPVITRCVCLTMAERVRLSWAWTTA